MTCVVGIIQANGQILIGADSAGVAGYQIRTRMDRKIFERDGFIFGFAGSFRAGQLLRYSLEMPKRASGQSLDEFMHTAFVETLRSTLAKGGAAFYEPYLGEAVPGHFLCGAEGRIFEVESDFQIAESDTPYTAIGCGAEVALGALHEMHRESLTTPRMMALRALQSASQYNATVREPFVLLNNSLSRFGSNTAEIVEDSSDAIAAAAAEQQEIEACIAACNLQVQAQRLIVRS